LTVPALLIAAPKSGSGKTTVTLGLIAALRKRGRSVRALKCGPDYIDAAFHAAASGDACPNIDSWAMSPVHMRQILADAGEGQEMVIIEAAMGLFDGVVGQGRQSGAAADVAALFKIPTILVVDMGGQGQSAGALVRGFASYDPDVTIVGVILNGVASERHRLMAAEGIEAAGVPILGWVPRASGIALPDRHLGLVQARERPGLQREIDRIAEHVAATVDLEQIEAVARPITVDEVVPQDGWTSDTLRPPGQRIAVAQDDAFSFMYAHLDAAWRGQGAEIVHFSPLADQAPTPDCDCCWLPGGYPELHGGAIAAARNFHAGLAEFAKSQPVHGECGGYMVLGESLEDADGNRHNMAGLLSHSTSFARRRLHLGYRRAHLTGDCILGVAGAAVRGHEFHYATAEDEELDDPLAELTDAQGQSLGVAGGRRGLVSGTFFHAIAAER
jgi:cobyrinic acid a,c-diamide synthase